jgi:hypothetical protein
MDRATKNPIVFDGMYRMSKLLKYIQTATSKPTLLMYLFRKHQGGQSLKQLVRKGDQYQAEIYQSPANLQGIKLNLGSLSYVECARKTLVMFACLPWQRDAKDDQNPGMQSGPRSPLKTPFSAACTTQSEGRRSQTWRTEQRGRRAIRRHGFSAQQHQAHHKQSRNPLT